MLGWTIRGSSHASFLDAIRGLPHQWISTSVCDKKGDWLISTRCVQAKQILAVLNHLKLDCDLISYGELNTTLEQVQEYAEVLDMTCYGLEA